MASFFLLQVRMYKNILTTNCITHIIQLKELYYTTNTVERKREDK